MTTPLDVNEAEEKLKRQKMFFEPLNKVTKISFWMYFAVFSCFLFYLEYLFIFKHELPRFQGYYGYLLTFSACFLICFYAFKNFLAALEKRMSLNVLSNLVAVDGYSDLASLRISHNNLYISSHVALFIFGLSLAFMLHNYGNFPLTDFRIVLSKPISIICLSSLVYYILTRIFYYIRNKQLDDAIFYAQIEHHKERYYKEKAENGMLDSEDKI
ncbi:hypothetical protein [Acinetobacter beijerinckii]|uniref:Uncharacterized protein n=1 Tax=Acinetobacter beijerinckii CIP 110307 TaxID=1217648 RepID=N9F6N5_9GAMM|nr:hypothetical protein [Acinetobacter beijerinckii]ENW02975.1 hypothetical protein F933_03381 [Acinetobacter beijerinckii CIP 110307]